VYYIRWLQEKLLAFLLCWVFQFWHWISNCFYFQHDSDDESKLWYHFSTWLNASSQFL
jgi:hypothetical protein